MLTPIQKDHAEKQPRWQFRKKKKIEKRRMKRQILAEKNKPPLDETIDMPGSIQEAMAAKQTYEKEKAQWEEREHKFKLIEIAKAKAKKKEQETKVLAQKRWQDTLMSLPLLPPKFNTSKESKTPVASPLKAFVRSEQDQPVKMTYRDRFLERKKHKKT